MGKITISQFLTVLQFPNSFLEGKPGFDHHSRSRRGKEPLATSELVCMMGFRSVGESLSSSVLFRDGASVEYALHMIVDEEIVSLKHI